MRGVCHVRGERVRGESCEGREGVIWDNGVIEPT